MVDSVNAIRPKIIFVTDPMCSWCWGMADDIQSIRADYAELVEFDLLLGGINPQSTQYVGKYGRQFLLKLWEDIFQTTGKSFGFKLPDMYIHNSFLPCLAIESVKEFSVDLAFDFLYQLQKQFFEYGQNVNDLDMLRKQAENFGLPSDLFDLAMSKKHLKEQVRFQFQHSKSFGTSVLPSVLFDSGDTCNLLMGGYANKETIGQALSKLNERGNYWPESIHVDEK